MSVDPKAGRSSTAGQAGRSADQIRRDIDIQRQQLGTNVEALRSKVTEVTDWRAQVEEHKQQLIIGAAAVGFLIGIKLMRGRRKKKRAAF